MTVCIYAVHDLISRISDSMHSTNIHSRASIPALANQKVHQLIRFGLNSPEPFGGIGVPLRGLACLCACLPQRTCLQNPPWDSTDSFHRCQKIFHPNQVTKDVVLKSGILSVKKSNPNRSMVFCSQQYLTVLSPEKHPAIQERLSDF